jgi:hypothetical protein
MLQGGSHTTGGVLQAGVLRLSRQQLAGEALQLGCLLLQAAKGQPLRGGGPW